MKATGKSHGEAEARMGANRNEKVSLASESLSKHFRLVLPNQLDRVGRKVRRQHSETGPVKKGSHPNIGGIFGLEDTSRSAL